MRQFLFLISALSLLILASCNKDEDSKSAAGSELIFGHFYGECFGETCVETYKLNDVALFEDIEDGYAGSGPFDFEQLSVEQFQIADGLKDELPGELLLAEDQTFGCPDCGDWGGVFIQWTDAGTTQTWLADMENSSNPDYLQDFVDNIIETIRLINQ